MKRRFTLLAIATFVSTSLMAGWDGSKWTPEDGPYTITSTADLIELATQVNNGNTFSEKTFIQTVDLDLGNNSWTPIGKSGKPFSGTYDGGGYVINNLYYSNPTGTNVGLFGYISGATLTRISVGSGNLSGSGSIAGICGAAYANSTISYCSNNATIFARKEQNGGICGYLEKSKVTDCINYGLISGYNMTGGIVGRCKNGTNDKIYNCINAGQVFSMCATSGNILGLCDGSVPADIQNCYYDNQINTLGAFTKSKSERYTIDDVENEYKGISTAMLTSGSALTGYVTEKWAFNNGLYPQLKIESENIAITVAATPVILSSNDKADNVTTDFNVSTVSNLTWNSGESANIAFSNGKATILKSTGVAVIGTKSDKGVTYTKKVYLKTNKQGATALGSKDSPLTIESEAELKAFREAVNTYGTYKHCSAYDGFKGIHFKVTVDISLSALYLTDYEPIGIHNSFKGIFDGNHRSINNVDVNLSSLPFVSGLFGGASYGEIKNISVSCGDGKKIVGKQYVGGICGAIFEETIDNCTSNCTIKLGSNSYAGGIVGTDKGFSTIKDCENTGSISGGGYIAGIMGLSNISTTFIGCKNTGTISGESDNIGGICAVVTFVSGNCVINNCENHGTVSTANNKTNIGGIIGYIPTNATEDISINNCINSGDIIINGTDAKYIGGIVGHTSKTLTLTNCLNLGQIKGNSNVGGIIGLNECTKIDIANAFNAGEISGHGIIGSINNQTSTCTSCVNIGKATASKYCIFDKQMCTGSGNAEDGKLTSEMLGDGVKSKLGTAHWTFTDGMYPMITTLEESDYMKVAATPLILKSDNDSENVKNNFTVGTANEAEWICNDAETVSFSEDGKGYITNPDLDETVEVYVTIKKVTKAIPLTILHRDGLTSPTITWERATEEDIYYGTKVSAEMIKANVQEEYKNDGTIKCNISENEVLHAGHYILTATFVPSEDNENTLASVTTIKTLDVLELEAAPFISWEPQDIIYGAENSDYSIKNATAIDGEGNPIEGDFFYEIPPLTVKKDENGELKKQTVSLFFIGTNYITYSPIEKEILVSPATPTVAWANPAPITYGTPLSALQLGAVSGVEGEFTYSAKNNETGVENTVESGTILNAGTYTLKAVFDAESENYADGESMTVQLVVNKLKPEITWEPETAFAELNYGETLDEDAFYASVDDEFDNFGSLSYFENNEAIDIWSVLPAGTHTITAKFEPSNDNYDNNTAVATIKINKATPVITWLSTDEERTVKYGTALSATQLNASVEPADAGTVRFAFDAAGTIDAMGASDRDAGTCAVYAIIDESDNYNSAQISKDIVIGKADLDITWDPQGFTYGATSEEIASAVETAEVSFNEQALTDGTFIYTYPSPLNAGDNQEVSVKFVPNSTNFNNAEDTKPINIAKATPEIVWEPQNVTYGASSEEIAEALKNAEAKFKGVSVNGDYNYTLPLTTDLQVGLEEGELIAAVIFTPTGDDAINFEEASAIVNVVVDKADPTITWEIADEDKTFTYGTALSDKQLNATTNAEGEIVYTDGETEIAIGDILDAGPHTITATLAESDNYNEATETITITVNLAESEITWETPATIAYGTPISAVELNATANTEGTFTYTLDGADAEGLTPNVGSYTITANFTPASTNYKEATATVTLKVASAAAEITWATPEAITYGTAIGAAQLNATANTEGEFVYSVREGDVLPAGADSLFVKFIPDSPDFGRALDTVILTVNKAELTVSVADTTVNIGDAIPEFKLVYTGFVNNENESNLTAAPTATCAATTAEAGVFDIVVSGGESDNYNITYTNGKLTVADASAAAPVITWADPAAITYGTLISADILNATVNAEGTLTYSVNVGDTLKAGTHKLIATFVPVNNTLTQNEYFITDTVTLTVNKANLTVSVADATVNQGDDMPSFSVDVKGFVLGETIADLTAIPGAKCNASTDNAGTFDIVVSGGESANYNFEYKNGKLTVKAKETAIAESAVKISVYPNPTADVFFVETEAEVELIYVYNMTGKLVLTETNVGKTRIDLANEPQGTYFVKVGEKTIKLLKF